jgi:hypothetical protein
MLRPFLFLFLLVGAYNGYAQGIDTDSTHHYIVMRSKSPNRMSYVLGESKRLKIYDKKGASIKGRLYFIDDSTVQVINTFTLKRDTFKISEIQKIQTASLLYQVSGITGLFVGGTWMIGGVALIGSAANASSTFAPIAIFFGAVAVAASIPVLATSAALLSGRKLNLKKYDLKLHTSKGYKLKRKHLKYLYPRF